MPAPRPTRRIARGSPGGNTASARWVDMHVTRPRRRRWGLGGVPREESYRCVSARRGSVWRWSQGVLCRQPDGTVAPVATDDLVSIDLEQSQLPVPACAKVLSSAERADVRTKVSAFNAEIATAIADTEQTRSIRRGQATRSSQTRSSTPSTHASASRSRAS